MKQLVYIVFLFLTQFALGQSEVDYLNEKFTADTIEIFGGIGTTWEADCHLYYRRAKQLSLFLGPANLWKERLAVELERLWANA